MDYFELSTHESLASNNLELLYSFSGLLVRSFISKEECLCVVSDLDDALLSHLPTDGGGVYSVYPEGSLRQEVSERIASLCTSLSKLQPDNTDSGGRFVHETLKYVDNSSLSMHRDKGGDSRTKMTLTVSGSATFLLESDSFEVYAGDLVVLPGKDINLQNQSPLHGTTNNVNRRMVLFELM